MAKLANKSTTAKTKTSGQSELDRIRSDPKLAARRASIAQKRQKDADKEKGVVPLAYRDKSQRKSGLQIRREEEEKAENNKREAQQIRMRSTQAQREADDFYGSLKKKPTAKKPMTKSKGKV